MPPVSAPVYNLTSTSRPLFLKLLMRWFSKPAFSAMALWGYALAPALGISSVWRRSTAAPALQLVSGRGGARGRGSTVTWRDAEGRSQRKIHARPGVVAATANLKPHLSLLVVLRSEQVNLRCLRVRRRAASVSRRVSYTCREPRAQFFVSDYILNSLTFALLSGRASLNV